MVIRETTEADLNAILDVQRSAFGPEEGPEIADLVHALLHDATAAPILSLFAVRDNEPIGHVLFTGARLLGDGPAPPAAILAPLAVVPHEQRRGVGGQLVREGLKRLTEMGIGLVFVLGHPEYYPRHGFRPAGVRGFEAPYPIASEHADAWMVLERRPGLIGRVRGKVLCADALNQPQHWQE